MHKTKSVHSRYMPGLDGLRAIAVIAVIAYHLDFNWASGGLLGVGVFFVLSGYLITDQIASELHREGKLDLKGFWLRRARRLLPAMLLVMAAVLLYLLLFERDRLPPLAGDVWSAVTYTSNWYLIFHHVSYFESFGPPSPFGHLWSLAVEEQFYLLWPLLLPAAALLLGRRGRTALLIVAAAAASAVAMAALYVPGDDPSRIYYGTDTRAFGLLLGAALALVWPSERLSAGIARRYRIALDGVGTFALLGILLMMRFTSEYDPFLYRGGLVLLTLLTVALVAALAHPSSKLGAWLGCRPMRWIGKRSYGIYLWHYPVIVLTQSQAYTEGPSPLRIALQIAASVVLAALSYKYVENPIRRGGLAAVRQGLRTTAKGIGGAWRERPTPGAPSRPAACLSVAALILLCVSCTGGAQPLGQGAAAAQGGGAGVVDAGVHAGGSKAPDGDLGGSGSGGIGGQGQPVTAGGGKTKPTPDPSPSAKPTTKPTVKPTPTPGKTPGPVQGGSKDPSQSSGSGTASGGADSTSSGGKTQSGKGITVIGDSVMLNVQPYLEDLLPGIVVDGEVGRQMREATDTIAALKAKGQLGSRVVVELGTNGSFTKKQLAALLDALDGADQIILMNTRVPRKWQDTVNDMLADVATDYDNITIGDWYGASDGHDEYFGKDGVHLGKTGAQAYAKLVADLLAKK